MQSDKSGSCRFGSGSLKIRDVALRSWTTVKFFLTLGIFITANHHACTTSWTGSTGLAGGAAVASPFFFLVFAWYGQFGWAVANLVVAAACIPAGPAVRIALVVFVTAGIACGGLWVRGKEPQNRDVPRTPPNQGHSLQ